MCDPVSIGLGTLSVASAGAGYASQDAAANAQEAANARTTQNAITKYNYDQEVLQAQATEDQMAASDKKFQQEKKAAEARGTAIAMASNNGIQVSSNSVEAMLNDINMQKAGDMAQVNDNVSRAAIQRSRQSDASGLNLKTTLDNLPVPQRPSPLGAVLSAGSGLLGAYKDHLKIKSWNQSQL